MNIEMKKQLATLLGFRPKESRDFNDGIAGLISEIRGYETQISTAERELAAHRDKLNALVESDENLTQSLLDGFAKEESRVKQNIKILKRRMETRQERLRTLENVQRRFAHEEERELLKFESQQATLAFAQFVTKVKEACSAYVVGREAMEKAEKRATAAGVQPGFMGAIENRAVTFMLGELYKIFGSHSHRIRVQSTPSALRAVDHVGHLADLLARQLRSANGNGKMMDEDEQENLETESANQAE